MMLELPHRLVEAILYSRGEADGRAWLRSLPRRVEHYLARWELESLGVAEGGAMSCCLFCRTSGGQDVVLKIPIDPVAGRTEARSLRRWAQTGTSPPVLSAAPSSGVFVMARVLPGTAAVPTGAPWESDRFGELITWMTRPQLGPLRRLPTLAQTLQRRVGFAEKRFTEEGYESIRPGLATARRALATLSAQTPRHDVLHGDLQFKNILIGDGGRWQAIDPRTCTGDLNAEAALWAVVQPAGSLAQRIDELGSSSLLDKDRLTRWCRVLAVLEYRRGWPESARRIEAFLGLPSS